MLSVPYSLGGPKKYIFLNFFWKYSVTSQFTVLYLFNNASNSQNYKLNLSQLTVFPIYSIVNWEENRELEVLLHRYKTVNLRG